MDDFVPLFNERDLSGWRPVNIPSDTFYVEDGMLVTKGVPVGFLATEEVYENFILELEWRHMKPGGNSGVFVWSDGLPAVGAPFSRAVEVQVIDKAPGRRMLDITEARSTWHGDMTAIRGAVLTPAGRPAANGSRSLPVELRSRPSPEWNHYRIECNRGEIRLFVNGSEVNRVVDCIPRTGFICLESEGSEIHFRNIRIKELPRSDTHPGFRADEGRGFVPLSNGRDFTGWKVDDDVKRVWSVNGNRFTAKANVPGRGLHLFTEKSYRNFELIADWRLPAEPAPRSRATFTPDGLYVFDDAGKQVRKDIPDAGDSGILLRGEVRYQVNIWSQPMGSGDINELHKEVSFPESLRRAMLPRYNADSAFGEWNRFHITLRDDRVTVVLNGVKVIDDVEMPGIPDEGPIGLQYHRDDVEFMNLYIRELP